MTGLNLNPIRCEAGAARRSFSNTRPLVLFVSAMALVPVGCNTIDAVPVGRVPAQFLDAERRNEYQDISLARLRQDPPEVYRLGPNDILGIYIKTILGDEATDEAIKRGYNSSLPPIHFPEDADQPPAVGVPVPVREDGTILLPSIKPRQEALELQVEGLTLVEATEVIRNSYKPEGTDIAIDPVLVTMIKRRTVRVLVVREEAGGSEGVTKRGRGDVLDLPAYENDILHALNETGGLPGTDAKNEIFIYRGMFDESTEADALISSLKSSNYDPCLCQMCKTPEPQHVTRIPIRFNPARPPQFTQEDIILQEGDIMMIKSREDEVFFTGGLLGGGEIEIPRDKDLDVLGAIALAGGPVGGGGQLGIMAMGGRGGGGGGGGGGGRRGGATGGVCPPTKLIVVRELPCNQQIAMRISLKDAVNNRASRILIKPNDLLILEYELEEELANVALTLIRFDFLFSGFSGNGVGR